MDKLLSFQILFPQLFLSIAGMLHLKCLYVFLLLCNLIYPYLTFPSYYFLFCINIYLFSIFLVLYCFLSSNTFFYLLTTKIITFKFAIIMFIFIYNFFYKFLPSPHCLNNKGRNSFRQRLHVSHS